MYTIKRINNGDISGFESDNWTISRNGTKPGHAFLEAVDFARNPTGLTPEDEAQTLGDLKAKSVADLTNTEEITANNTTYEVSGVTVIRGAQRDFSDLVLVGAVPGSRELEDALGVVITSRTNSDSEQEVQYDFIYPGMQVYITDRFGNTVESLR